MLCFFARGSGYCVLWSRWSSIPLWPFHASEDTQSLIAEDPLKYG